MLFIKKNRSILYSLLLFFTLIHFIIFLYMHATNSIDIKYLKKTICIDIRHILKHKIYFQFVYYK